MEEPEWIVRPRSKQLQTGIDFRLGDIESVQTTQNRVYMADGQLLDYDVLVIARGASQLPGETEGVTGTGCGDRVFNSYSLESATALRDALARFNAGRLVVVGSTPRLRSLEAKAAAEAAQAAAAAARAAATQTATVGGIAVDTGGMVPPPPGEEPRRSTAERGDRHADQVPARPARARVPRRLVYLRERDIRDRVQITYVTPLDGAFTKPVARAE